MALAAVAVGGNLLVYSSLDSSEPVVQAVRDVPAGEQITGDMFRTVDVDADSTVNLIDGDRLDSLVGSYAKVRLVAGSLVTAESLQATPLVTPGKLGGGHPGRRWCTPARAARAGAGASWSCRRERSGDDTAITSVPGRVVGLPTATSSALGLQSLSIEVAADDAATIAAADDVRVVLVEPSEDPAADGGRAVTVIAVVGDATTTTAVAIAVGWPAADEVIVLEADPSGGSLAAWLDTPSQPSLATIVANVGPDAGQRPPVGDGDARCDGPAQRHRRALRRQCRARPRRPSRRRRGGASPSSPLLPARRPP